MPGANSIGLLIIIGVVVVGLGLLLLLLGRIPLFGRLPGDITIRRKNTTIFAPITTMIILSLLLSLILTVLANLLLR
ncbi:DUF2905 domain-containing protein [Nitrolancea hollandica]|uniref:DUF2905 domain-containing protein n=1 Tax=Nitrolancea hollandica Lb TaxID=1129897 RepID=I4EN69_9BACT|nr:DUF2905 domain-containing protein [Nitrolancea hollandica]CCF86132.1 conserved hypothetical protein [Nitrolancea hollandica Lb]